MPLRIIVITLLALCSCEFVPPAPPVPTFPRMDVITSIERNVTTMHEVHYLLGDPQGFTIYLGVDGTQPHGTWRYHGVLPGTENLYGLTIAFCGVVVQDYTIRPLGHLMHPSVWEPMDIE